MKLSVSQGMVKFERNQYEASIHIGSNVKYFFITLSYDPTKFHLYIHSVLNNGENIEQVKTIIQVHYIFLLILLSGLKVIIYYLKKTILLH